MICDRCGAPRHEDETHCPSCGNRGASDALPDGFHEVDPGRERYEDAQARTLPHARPVRGVAKTGRFEAAGRSVERKRVRAVVRVNVW